MKQQILVLSVLAAIFAGCSQKPKTAAAGAEIKPVVPPASATAAAPAASAPVAKPAMLDVFTCTRDGDVRELYTEPVTPAGCKLWYSNKKTDPTAWSSKGTGHCIEVGQRIKNTLEVAGFKCAPVAAVNAK